MVIELKEDKLADYMSAERLLVVVSVDWCGSCKKIKPKLYEIDDRFTIVIIDGERHLRSMKFLPGKTSSYPRLGYYEKGYYLDEFKISELEEYKQKYTKTNNNKPKQTTTNKTSKHKIPK